jgi:HEPN domain-containing protein
MLLKTFLFVGFASIIIAMDEKYLEWFTQSYYDFDTAKYMHKGGRYIYTIFMCHLSIEKALKGLFQLRQNVIPPKTHNLVFFIEELKLEPDKTILKFIIKLNQLSIFSRYPEDLQKVKDFYNKSYSKDFLDNTEKVLQWIKQLS